MYPGRPGLLAVLRDVTGQVLAEQQVHRALAAVEASRRELGSLAGRGRKELECLAGGGAEGKLQGRGGTVEVMRWQTCSGGPCGESA